MKVLPPTGINVPKPPNMEDNPDLTYYLLNTVSILVREIEDRVHIRRPVSEILMLSPNESVYKITVDDAGNITTTLVKSG